MSDALNYANRNDALLLGNRWCESFAGHVGDLRALAWFDTTDPLNQRFTAALTAAASGQFPARV
jgi:hypothetical protein